MKMEGSSAWQNTQRHDRKKVRGFGDDFDTDVSRNCIFEPDFALNARPSPAVLPA
jgi:hypothetical protein